MSTSPAASDAALQPFLEEGLITEVIGPLKSGKEATAYLCRGSRKLGRRFAVCKVYHDRTRRDFANKSAYVEGRIVLDSRAARAIAAGTRAGANFGSSLWVDHEFETLSVLHYAGVNVPEPFAADERALLIELIGERDVAAPMLHSARVDPAAVPALVEQVLGDIGLMLACNVIHGDLSPYNILLAPDRAVIIDFPQAIDPRFNAHAPALLERDIRNVGRWAACHGVTVDASAVAGELWERFEHGG